MAYRACLLALFCFSLAVRAIPKGELEEWELNLFEVANANKNAQCESFEILDQPGHYAGYFSIDGTEDGHLFYMYFENRNKDPDAPFVFWTNGGPGCSSFFGLFKENGPYDIQEDMTVCWKEHGWDIGHNIVFVEQPINVGYSYSTDGEDKVYDEQRVGDDMVAFFYAFLKAHKELAEKDLYITGESFAGHYLPAIARSILLANERKKDMHLNLQGIFLVDPWTSPSSHYYSYPVYAYQQGLIGEETRDKMLTTWSDCDNSLRFCDMRLPIVKKFACNSAYAFCQSRLFTPLLFLHPFINYYDIRRNDCVVSGCYDIKLMTAFMNDPKVKEVLGAKKSINWEDCGMTVRREMGWDVATDMRDVVEKVLNEGIRTSVVVGDKDLICNYVGNERWVDRMSWEKSIAWAKTKNKTLVVNGEEAGYVRVVEPLSFVIVQDAGHMIPMDQPVVALELLTRFTRGKKYPTGKGERRRRRKDKKLPTT